MSNKQLYYSVFLCNNYKQEEASLNKKTSKKDKIKDDRITIPILYPDKKADKTNVTIPSEMNVEYAKEWVDFNHK